jgi:hypothetical protein
VNGCALSARTKTEDREIDLSSMAQVAANHISVPVLCSHAVKSRRYSYMNRFVADFGGASLELRTRG